MVYPDFVHSGAKQKERATGIKRISHALSTRRSRHNVVARCARCVSLAQVRGAQGGEFKGPAPRVFRPRSSVQGRPVQGSKVLGPESRAHGLRAGSKVLRSGSSVPHHPWIVGGLSRFSRHNCDSGPGPPEFQYGIRSKKAVRIKLQ